MAKANRNIPAPNPILVGIGLGAQKAVAPPDVSGAVTDTAKMALDATGLGGVSKFVGDITNGRVWASIGWIALGLMIILIGIVQWLKKTGHMPGESSGGGSGGGGAAGLVSKVADVAPEAAAA